MNTPVSLPTEFEPRLDVLYRSRKRITYKKFLKEFIKYLGEKTAPVDIASLHYRLDYDITHRQYRIEVIPLNLYSLVAAMFPEDLSLEYLTKTEATVQSVKLRFDKNGNYFTSPINERVEMPVGKSSVSRDDLIELCESSLVHYRSWKYTESLLSYISIGECWALLQTGLPYSIDKDGEFFLISFEAKGHKGLSYHIPTQIPEGLDWHTPIDHGRK